MIKKMYILICDSKKLHTNENTIFQPPAQIREELKIWWQILQFWDLKNVQFDLYRVLHSEIWKKIHLFRFFNIWNYCAAARSIICYLRFLLDYLFVRLFNAAAAATTTNSWIPSANDLRDRNGAQNTRNRRLLYNNTTLLIRKTAVTWNSSQPRRRSAT